MADVQLSDLISSGLLSARPAAADALLYQATDTKLWYISDGASWTALAQVVDGGDVTSGTVADARIAGTLARDSELTSAISTHEGASDPHPGYTTAAELAATKLDDLATPDDNTDLNATTGHHGLLPKLDNNAAHYLDGQGGWTTPSGSGGALLGVTSYGGSASNYTTTSSSLADVDATNAKVTFVAPASGNVLVKMTAVCSNSTAVGAFFGIRESTSDVAGKTFAKNGTPAASVMVPFLITGLTPGSSHTYKAAFCTSGGTFTIFQEGNAAGNGQVTLEVWAAP